MNDRAALLANVLNGPADDTARLVLADWVEEHGEEPLGRFRRAGGVASRFPAGEWWLVFENLDPPGTVSRPGGCIVLVGAVGGRTEVLHTL